MRQSVSKKWLLSGFVGLGLVAIAPSPVLAKDPPRSVEKAADRALARGENFEEPIDYEKIPEHPKAKLHEERHGDKVLASFRIHRSGRDYYRVTVAHKKGERVLLVTADAVLQNVEDIRPSELAAYRQNPDAWYRDYDDRMIAQDRVVTREVERVTAGIENPERVSWDQLPGRVRATLARENGGEKVDYIIRYHDKTANNVLYQTTLAEGGDRKHLLQILPDGSIFNEGDYTPKGRVADEWRPQSIGFDDLPKKVRDTVDQEAPRGRIPHVDVASRRGGKIYTVEIANREGTRYLTMNEDGKVLSDVTDKLDGGNPVPTKNR